MAATTQVRILVIAIFFQIFEELIEEVYFGTEIFNHFRGLRVDGVHRVHGVLNFVETKSDLFYYYKLYSCKSDIAGFSAKLGDMKKIGNFEWDPNWILQ